MSSTIIAPLSTPTSHSSETEQIAMMRNASFALGLGSILSVSSLAIHMTSFPRDRMTVRGSAAVEPECETDEVSAEDDLEQSPILGFTDRAFSHIRRRRRAANPTGGRRARGRSNTLGCQSP